MTTMMVVVEVQETFQSKLSLLTLYKRFLKLWLHLLKQKPYYFSKQNILKYETVAKVIEHKRR